MAGEESRDELESTRGFICPYCKHEHPPEDYLGFVTYWGDGPPGEVECELCESTFSVQETVERSWTSRRLAE